jgi:hypothetical protein
MQSKILTIQADNSMIGHEVLKNLVLAGVKEIGIYYDDKEEECHYSDELCTCLFYQADCPADRSLRILHLMAQLKTLNPIIKITEIRNSDYRETGSRKEILTEYHLVADFSKTSGSAVQWNNICRLIGKKYYWSCMNANPISPPCSPPSSASSASHLPSYIGWNFCDYGKDYRYRWYNASTDKVSSNWERLEFYSLEEFIQSAAAYFKSKNSGFSVLKEREKKQYESFYLIWRHLLSATFLHLNLSWEQEDGGRQKGMLNPAPMYLPPLASILGGQAAQDIVRGLIEFDKPIYQFLLFDATKNDARTFPPFATAE